MNRRDLIRTGVVTAGGLLVAPAAGAAAARPVRSVCPDPPQGHWVHRLETQLWLVPAPADEELLYSRVAYTAEYPLIVSYDATWVSGPWRLTHHMLFHAMPHEEPHHTLILWLERGPDPHGAASMSLQVTDPDVTWWEEGRLVPAGEAGPSRSLHQLKLTPHRAGGPLDEPNLRHLQQLLRSLSGPMAGRKPEAL